MFNNYNNQKYPIKYFNSVNIIIKKFNIMEKIK